jgi:hypothetical protein
VRPYEIESWDSAGGKAAVWVLVDTVFVNNSTQNVRMAWGDKNAPDNGNGRAVFDTGAGFVCVMHLNDGASGTNANSAQARYNGVAGGTPGTIVPAAGIIAKADTFANTHYVTMGDIQIGPAITMSAWVKPVMYTQWGKIMCKGRDPYSTPQVTYSLELLSANPAALGFRVGLAANADVTVSTAPTALPTNTWTYVVGTYDGTTVRLYLNGAQAASQPLNAAPMIANSHSFSIGAWDMMPQERFNGLIDEARISRSAWAPDFIKLSYENQRAGSAMVTIR